jgi:opacity protein-like surface antigen
MKKLILPLIAVTTLNATAHAAEAPYIGVDAAYATLDTATHDPNMYAARIRLGSELHRYFGVETQLLTGVVEDKWATPAGNLYTNLNGTVGLYGRLQLPVGDAFTLYGLAGYARSWIKVNSTIPPLGSFRSHDSDFSAGGGIDIHLSKKASLSIDYMQYIEGLSSVAAGVRIKM